MKNIIIGILLVVTSVSAQGKEKIIEDGFKAFKKGGAALAWPAFTKNGPMEGSNEIAAQAAQFDQIEAYYGNYVGHDYISEKKLGDNNKILYVILNLENGPLFGRFFLYKKADGTWIIPNFNFHVYAEQIWPENIYSECNE